MRGVCLTQLGNQLVQRSSSPLGIALPQAIHSEMTPLFLVVGGYLFAAVATASLTYSFLKFAARTNQNVLFDLRQRLLAFGMGRVVGPAGKVVEQAGLGVLTDTDDEGETVPLTVSLVQGRDALHFRCRQGIEAGAGLLLRRR